MPTRTLETPDCGRATIETPGNRTRNTEYCLMPDPSGAPEAGSAAPQASGEPPEDATSLPPTAAVILAAGKSTRMRSKTPKPLHPICGLPMTAHVIRACRAAGVQRILVVVGHEADVVRAGLGDEV